MRHVGPASGSTAYVICWLKFKKIPLKFAESISALWMTNYLRGLGFLLAEQLKT